MENRRERRLRTGELAERTGLTVRTLRWYDEIGLLSPSERNEGGQRLYAEGDLARLQKILSLKGLGFSLEEITSCLDDPSFDHYTVVKMHRIRLERELGEIREVHDRLHTLERAMEQGGSITAENFIHVIEAQVMFEKYYTEEQLKQLAERAERIGPERMEEVQREWADLIAEVRTEMEAGTDPSDERVQRLARRWGELLEEFTGGDPGIAASLHRMYQQEGPPAASQGMVDEDVMGYMGRVMGWGGFSDDQGYSSS